MVLTKHGDQLLFSVARRMSALIIGFVELDPEDVYFTHARVRPFFSSCGRRLDETLADIADGHTRIEDLPTITVLDAGDHYFSLNNRRLWVFKELRSRGIIEKVRVRVKEALPREKERYTTDRCVLNAKVMKEHGGTGGDDGHSKNTEVDQSSKFSVEGAGAAADGGVAICGTWRGAAGEGG